MVFHLRQTPPVRCEFCQFTLIHGGWDRVHELHDHRPYRMAQKRSEARPVQRRLAPLRGPPLPRGRRSDGVACGGGAVDHRFVLTSLTRATNGVVPAEPWFPGRMRKLTTGLTLGDRDPVDYFTVPDRVSAVNPKVPVDPEIPVDQDLLSHPTCLLGRPSLSPFGPVGIPAQRPLPIPPPRQILRIG